MKVLATALLAASMASIACAASEKKSYCVAKNDEGNWVFLTASEKNSGASLSGSFKGLREDAATVHILSGDCGSSDVDEVDVQTNRGGIGKFEYDIQSVSDVEGNSISIAGGDGNELLCCEWTSYDDEDEGGGSSTRRLL